MTSPLLRELRELSRLSVPIAMTHLGIMAMSLVDTAAIGRVSVDDMAGAGIGRSIGFASSVVGIGVTSSLEPLAAQAIGAGEHSVAWRSYLGNLRAAMLVWVPSIIAAFAVTLALPPLHVSQQVVHCVRLYLLGQAPGLALTLAFLSSKTFLQAHGRTRPALLGSVVANIVNLAMSNLLVRGDDALRAIGLRPVGMPALGALGGGIAFSVASLVLFLFAVAAAARLRPPEAGGPVSLSRIYRIGIPAGLQLLAEIGIFSLVALLSGSLGPDVAAAHQVAFAMASFTFMGALGVSGATAVRVGRAIGAGRSPRRPGLLGIGLGGAVMVFGAVAFWSAPRLLVSAFTHDAHVIQIGVVLLRIAAIFQLFDGMQVVAVGALRGAGDVRSPFVAHVMAHWFVGLPIALTLAFLFRLGAQGLWLGLTMGLVIVSIVLLVRFLRVTRGTIARV